MATQYIGDLPTRPMTAKIATPFMTIQYPSCLSFQYITIASLKIYSQLPGGSRLNIKNDIDETYDEWSTYSYPILPGIYSVVWESSISLVSLKAKNFTSGVIYPFVMDAIVIIKGPCVGCK